MHQDLNCRATDVDINRKFVLTVAAFVVLALLAWKTLSNSPIQVGEFSISLRDATLCILSLFALRSGLYFWRTKLEESDSEG